MDSSPNFAAAGTEFNSHFSHAITKHALPIGTVVMYDSGADTGSQGGIPNGYAPCDGGSYTSRKGIAISTPDIRDRFLAAAYPNSQYNG